LRGANSRSIFIVGCHALNMIGSSGLPARPRNDPPVFLRFVMG
jgi:hypothetical protein